MDCNEGEAMDTTTPGPWEWDGVAVSNADGQPWMEWQPLDPYLAEDREQEYEEARKQADGAFIAAARALVPQLQALLIEERAKARLYRELYTERASHDPEPCIQTWESVTEYDRACFRKLAAR